MQWTEAAAETEYRVTLGCFEVGGRAYGVDVAHVREVVRWRAVTPLPGAPVLVEGVIDLRGSVIPVVDLSRALGGAPISRSPRARILIAQIGELVVGLVVEAAIGVLPVTGSDLGRDPAPVSASGRGMTAAVVRRSEGEPLVVLSLEHLLELVHDSGSSATQASA